VAGPTTETHKSAIYCPGAPLGWSQSSQHRYQKMDFCLASSVSAARHALPIVPYSPCNLQTRQKFARHSMSQKAIVHTKVAHHHKTLHRSRNKEASTLITKPNRSVPMHPVPWLPSCTSHVNPSGLQGKNTNLSARTAAVAPSRTREYDTLSAKTKI